LVISNNTSRSTLCKTDWRIITMKKSIKIGASLAFLVITAMSMPSSEASAKTNVVAVSGISYNVNFSLQDNLKSLIGKKVYLTLDSGNTFAGFIKEVGDHLVHLEKLDGKSYFDALIRIENVSAIETKFRDVQR
jgi:small nuclear ribonucleoprotein (snRNP)-like protein